MGQTRIKKSDAIKVKAYMTLTGSVVTVEDGYWVLSEGDRNDYYDDVKNLMPDINYALRQFRRTAPKDYEDAMNNDGRLKL